MQSEPPKEKSLARLDRIADDITVKYAEANRLANDSKQSGRAAIIAVIECGKMLMRARRAVGNRGWEKWLNSNCPNIERKTAWRWMALAGTHVPQIESCKGIRQAYIAAGIIPKPEPTKKALGTADVNIFDEFVGQVARQCGKIVEMVEEWDMQALPPEHKEQLRVAIGRIEEMKGKL